MFLSDPQLITHRRLTLRHVTLNHYCERVRNLVI